MDQGVALRPPVEVTRLSQDYVCGNDHLFNTNNLWADQGRERPTDYLDVLDRGSTKHWVPPNTPIITLDAEDTRWMLKAAIIGLHTGKHSHIYDDELQKTVAKHQHKFPPVPDGSPGWFIRTERVSLKYGQHKIGPYTGLREIIESITSSIVGHECISPRDDLDAYRIYFLPWKNIDQEFRVFVFNNRVSAISTQHYPEINDRLATLSDEQVAEQVAYKIIDHFEINLKQRLQLIVGPNYTMDIAFLNDGSVYFIEPNSFGAEYAAGSAAFNWVYEQS
jgi:hypothetical protein